MKDVYVYIHVCCLGEWKLIFSNILFHIKNSGLYDIIKEIRCGILGDFDENLFKDEKIKIVYNHYDTSLYETSTINKILKDSHTDDFLVLYLHTKGVTKVNNKNVMDWVNYMLYFNIYKYKDCINLLKNHDCIGVNLQQGPEIHYSGNFWWSKSLYIRKLNKCPNDYSSAEKWLTKEEIGKFVCLWASNINHYTTEYPESKYRYV